MLCYVMMMQEQHQHRNIRYILQAHHIDVGLYILQAKHYVTDLQIYMHACHFRIWSVMLLSPRKQFVL